MTLEEGFFRLHGYKYQELAKCSEAEHLNHIAEHLQYMICSGAIAHLVLWEQGACGSPLLQQASAKTAFTLLC